MNGSVGLYVHFPYCPMRCTYCDFNTYVVEKIPAADYTAAVLAEGERRAPAYADWTLSSVYFGGGTPSLWGADQVGRVLEAASWWFPHRASDVEITLECNPGEAQAGTLASYHDVGVNRLSLGVQTLDDAALATIGRRHDATAAMVGLKTALKVGFRSVSADLIFGLPGQDMTRWTHDLKALADTGVPHISVYHLTLEEGTRLTHQVKTGKVVLPDEDTQADMFEAIGPTLSPYGLGLYETSNAAKSGHESRHNTLYWTGRPYLGLGAGAHSFLPPARWDETRTATRSSSRKHHSTYVRDALAGDELVFAEEIDRDTHLRERLFTGLRNLAGLDLGALSEELNLDVPGRVADPLASLTQRGLIELRDQTLHLTETGRRLADTVALELF